MNDLTDLRKIATLYPKDRVVDGETVLALITRLEQAEAAVARVREVSNMDEHGDVSSSEETAGFHVALRLVRRALEGEQS